MSSQTLVELNAMALQAIKRQLAKVIRKSIKSTFQWPLRLYTNDVADDAIRSFARYTFSFSTFLFAFNFVII